MHTHTMRLSPGGLDRARKLLRIIELVSGADSELDPLIDLLRPAIDRAEVVVTRPRRRPQLRLVK